MMNIHDRIEYIILQEKLSIAAFERHIGVGRNFLSTSLRKQSAISHEVIIKIFEHFPKYSLDWILLEIKGPKISKLKNYLLKLSALSNGGANKPTKIFSAMADQSQLYCVKPSRGIVDWSPVRRYFRVQLCSFHSDSPMISAWGICN